ncbi:MAG: M81 family metallopeptidase [Rubrobacteraceae bacterium]
MHETNTFSEVYTDKRLFEQWDWSTGDDIIREYAGVRDALAWIIHGRARPSNKGPAIIAGRDARTPDTDAPCRPTA